VARTEGHRSAVARSSEFGLRPLRSTGAHGQGRNRERGEHGDLGSALTVARVVVLRPGDDVEATAETKLDNGSARALGEGAGGECRWGITLLQGPEGGGGIQWPAFNAQP
jgi:hypothetical protein